MANQISKAGKEISRKGQGPRLGHDPHDPQFSVSVLSGLEYSFIT
jgi:hypothetical protein